VFTVYNLFEFLHIAAVIVWIGGIVTLSIINARLAREQDRAALVALSRQSGFYGRAILGPAAGITLITGIVMVVVLGLGFGSLWIIWGLVGIFGSLVLGAALIRRATVELSELAPTAAPNDPRVIALQRRLATLNTINLLLLLSVVWAMVFKPTL
jgi:uncharacterized membrane protein